MVKQDKYIIEPNVEDVFKNAINIYLKSKLRNVY